jgi:hypothetical protein
MEEVLKTHGYYDLQDTLQQLKDLALKLINSDGTIKPGVTAEQLKFCLESIKKTRKLLEKGEEEIQNRMPQFDELREQIGGSRRFMLELEEKYNTKFDPTLRKMYDLE